ncbi:hypothetical protein HWV62_26971 [Athelia sp. TMB]|nr:hypothetical protein HWV62_26971 [Athelia sp. TMB]
MDLVPPEIWTRILSHACTDAGETGRSLSLVSKFIQNASARVKLQSLAAHGPQQVFALEDLLRRTPPHLRRVRNLYLSHTSFPSSTHLSTETGHPSLPEGNYRDARLKQAAEKKKLAAACCRIFQVVAESIEVLYLDGRGTFDFGDSPPIIFPRLKELTSNGLPFRESSGDRGTMSRTGVFPKLHRWHLMTYPRRSKPDPFTSITTLAPAITHLRFSNLEQEPFFPSDLKVALNIAVPWQPSSHARTRSSRVGFHPPISPIGRLPSSIQYVYVKPAAPPTPGGMCGTPVLSYRSLIGGLEVLRKSDSRIVLLPSYDSYWEARCTSSDWEDRINGGDGCWSLREQITS